jgi:NAD(P)-dependent dehydrogenase (short-subunit alcohol dehydrogenase family)
VLAWEGDVSSESSVNALSAQVSARFSHCDILVNCAGIFPLKPFAEMTFADWRRVQSVHLDSVYLMCAAFVPAMRARRWGRIVNLASSTLDSVLSGFVIGIGGSLSAPPLSHHRTYGFRTLHSNFPLRGAH